MKKIIFLAVIIAAIATSCQDKEEYKLGAETNLFLEDCISRVPNADSNEFTRREFEDTLKVQMKKKVGHELDLIKGLPMTLRGYIPIDKNEENNIIEYCVQFDEYYSPEVDRYKFLRNDYEVMFIMPEDSLKKIIDSKKYTIQGKFMGYDKSNYPKLAFMYTKKLQVSRDRLKIDFGTLVLEDVKIEPFLEEK